MAGITTTPRPAVPRLWAMSLPVRIAVFGSCLTRDVFNRRFSPHYKDLFDCVLLANQTSLISLMSPPVDDTGADLSNLDALGEREVRADLRRSFLVDLERLEPDYLIVDWFADVHFGCAVLEGGIVTRNRWKTVRTPFYQQTWREDIVPRGAAYRERWEEAARQFVAEVRRRSPRTRIVLHAAQNATAFRTAQGDIVPLASADQFARMNKRWQRLNASFAGLADATIDVFHDEVVSFEEHPWGRFAVHYELSYHAAFLSKLTALALDDARTAAEQASSPPRPRRRWAGKRGA